MPAGTPYAQRPRKARPFDPEKHCGAQTGRGPCKAWKGAGTSHVGHGQCMSHGGSTPNGRKHGAKLAALSFARGALGAEAAVSPVGAMEQSVRLAGGLVTYYQHEISTATLRLGEDGTPAPDRGRIEILRPQFEDAIRLEKDCAKAALDAGVAERRQALAERTAALLTAVFMDAIQAGYGDVNTPERQLKAAEAIGRGLLALEQGEAIEGTAREIG